MDYGEVLTRAWKIIWRYKVLWLFGILASCGSSSSSSSAGSNLSYSLDYGDLPLRVQNVFERFSPAQWTALAAASVVVVVFLIALTVFVNIIGRAGLIRGTQEAEAGVERIGLGSLFQSSLPFFWRVLGLTLLIGVAIFIVVFALAALFFTGVVITFGMLLLCLIPLLCLIVPVSFLISIVIEQSTIALVVEDLGIIDGLQRGWEITRRNLGAMIVMGLILYVGVSGIGGFIIALPLMVILVPLLIGIFANSSQSLYSGLLIFGLCLVAYLPVLIVLGGILKSYVSSAWTLTYLRLTAK